MYTVLIKYYKVTDGGHALLDPISVSTTEVIQIDDLMELNDRDFYDAKVLEKSHE